MTLYVTLYTKQTNIARHLHSDACLGHVTFCVESLAVIAVCQIKFRINLWVKRKFQHVYHFLLYLKDVTKFFYLSCLSFEDLQEA